MPEEEEKIKGRSPEEGEGVSIELLIKGCMDSSGYVIFAAKIAGKPDEKGNLVIDYNYRRYHFSYEDTREAVKRFKEEFLKDITRDFDHD